MHQPSDSAIQVLLLISLQAKGQPLVMGNKGLAAKCLDLPPVKVINDTKDIPLVKPEPGSPFPEQSFP